MMFIPNSTRKEEMLSQMDLSSVDELFEDIPKKIRCKGLNLAKGQSQLEVESHLKSLAKKNKSCDEMMCFLGGGIKPHYIPAAVKALVSRSEFYTAYTPYQPEVSQGFLQAMFEYQSLICALTGMDVSNASLYDGETAIGEAALMCCRATKKSVVLVPESISRQKKQILDNYTKGSDIKIVPIPFDAKKGRISLSDVKKLFSDEVAGVYIENPNFFGIFEEDIVKIGEFLSDKKALFAVGVDPISLGVLKNPGQYGADIVIGEGRALGGEMDFGGSSLGFFACKRKYLRQLPGRIIGLTTDSNNKRAFCMSMQTREQHIRRGRATSNICTNQGLCALTACIHLSWLGGSGLERLAKINYDQAHKASRMLSEIKGCSLAFSGEHFNEFILKTPDAEKIHQYLLKKNIHGGLILSSCHSNLKDCMLFGVTEMHSNEQIETLVSAVREVVEL